MRNDQWNDPVLQSAASYGDLAVLVVCAIAIVLFACGVI